MDIFTLLARGEGKELEFKERAEKAAKDVVAFLNTEGGIVLIGVNDEKNIIGIRKREEEVLENVLANITPSPAQWVKWEKVKVGGKELLVVRVSKSPFLHFYAGRSYVRVGTASIPLSWEEIARRLSETGEIHFDEALNPSADEKDIDEAIVERYLEERERRRGVERPRLGKDKLLRMLGIKRRGGITNAGLLFFSSHPQSFFPSAAIRIEVRRGSLTMHSQIIEGSVWEQWEKAYASIKKLLPTPSYIVEGKREERLAVHPYILREGLANAIAHRNYADSRFIDVIITDEELVIRNPGGFPPEVSPEEPEHKPRNPLLSRYLYDVGIIDKYGSGIERMRAVATQGHYPLPFYAKWREVSELHVPFGHPILSYAKDEKEKLILSALLVREKSSGELSRELGISQDTVLRVIRRLIERGLVEQLGKGRGRKYRLRQL